MALNILPETLSKLETMDSVRIAHLVALELPGGNNVFRYMTDYGHDIVYKGIVYKSSTVKRIGNVKQTKMLTNFNVSVQVSGAVQEEFDIAMDGSSLIDRRIIIYKLFLENDDTIIPMFSDGTSIKYFEGVITTVSTQDNVSVSGTGTSTITWSCASVLNDFEAVNGRITDDESHRGIMTINGVDTPTTAAKRPEYQQDKGFFHANKSVKVLASYQTKEKRYKMESRRAGGLKGLLGVRNYNMVEYWETVTREVNMDVNLTAKFIPVVYGVQKIPGIPVFVDTSKDNPDEVWAVYAFCEGEIDGFLDFYLEDAPIICVDDKYDPEKRVCLGQKRDLGNTISLATPTPKDPTTPSIHGQQYIYNDGFGDIDFWTFHGLQDQEAAKVLVDIAAQVGFKLQSDGGFGAEYWDSDFKLLDTAYVVVKYTLNADRTNIPQLSAEVQGRKVKVYKQDGSSVSDKTSLNFTWQTLDYATNKIFGAGIELNDLSIPSFYEVAQLQDIIDTSYNKDWVPFWRYIGWTNKDAENRQIMQGSALLNTDATVLKNLNDLLTQFDASFNIISGTYVLSVEAAGSTILDITEDFIIDGKIDTTDTTSKEKYNSIQASILDPASGWGTNAITFYNAEYKKEDKNKELKANVVFPFITNYYTARSRAERILKRSRYTKKVSFKLPFAYFWLKPNDRVTLTSTRHKWNKKKFLIEDIEWSTDGKVSITAREYVDGIFINSEQSDNSSNQIPDIQVQVLPPRGVQYSPDLKNEIVGLNGELTWLPSLTKNVAYYTVRWTGSFDTYTVPVTGSEPPDVRIIYQLFNLPKGTYTFEVRAAIATGIVSKPTLLTVEVNASKNLPIVPNFRCTNLAPGYSDIFIGSSIYLAWDGIGGQVTDVSGLLYNLQILTKNGTILHEVNIKNTTKFEYTLQQNKADYSSIHGSLGINRQFQARIMARGDNGESSVDWARL